MRQREFVLRLRCGKSERPLAGVGTAAALRCCLMVEVVNPSVLNLFSLPACPRSPAPSGGSLSGVFWVCPLVSSQLGCACKAAPMRSQPPFENLPVNRNSVGSFRVNLMKRFRALKETTDEAKHSEWRIYDGALKCFLCAVGRSCRAVILVTAASDVLHLIIALYM